MQPLTSIPPKIVLNLANHYMSRPITVPSTEDNTMSNQNEQPSMVGAHLNYVKGAAASALGYESGDQTKQQAVEDMREANKQGDAPSQSNILGSVESAAGNLTGCEGMQNEGESRKVHGGGASGGMTG